MDTFRRLFSCGPIFAKKSEEEEGDAAKEVPVPPHLACVALLPMLADAAAAALPCTVGASVHVLLDPGTAALFARAARARARRCRCRRQPRRRSTTRRSAQVSAPTLPARSRPRSRPPARRLVRQRAQRCVFLAKPCTAHALTPDQWCAALAADAAAERRDAQPVVRDARGGAGSEHATKPISRCHHRQPRLMGHSVPHTHSTLAASQACRRACVRESLSFVVCTSFSALT